MSFGFHNISSPAIALSPMDGVTDCAFREIVKKYGNPDLLYTEFVNVHGLSLGIEKLFNELRYTEFQRPILSQIYGHEVEYFYPASLICLMLGFNGIDINMGCPAKKVSDRGAGAGLIRNPQNAKNIISEVKRAREDFKTYWKDKKYSENQVKEFFNIYLSKQTDLKIKPTKLASHIIQLIDNWKIQKEYITSEQRLNSLTVSVKTRIGYEKNEVEEWIKNISEASPDFIALHGRTLKQMYTGSASWEAIALAVKSTNIPILANGDIKSVSDAKSCLDLTKAQGLLVGRGSYGDPFLLKDIKESMKQNKEISSERNIETIKEMMLDHCECLIKYKGEERFFEVRKHLAWSVKGLNNASEIRKNLVVSNSISDVEKELLKLI